MNTALITVVGSLVGVVVGGVLTQLGNRRTLKLQGSLAVEAEQRERTMTSAATAIETAGKLLLLEERPDEPSDRAVMYRRKDVPPEPPEAEVDAWEARQSELVLVLETAVLDLPEQFRQQLNSAIKVVRVGQARDVARLESQQRHAACLYALDCLGAFRRGEALPDQPDSFEEALEAATLQIDMWEEHDRSIREYRRQQRSESRDNVPPSSSSEN
jgi:hypothetical protein